MSKSSYSGQRWRCILCGEVIELGEEEDLSEEAMAHLLQAHVTLVRRLAEGLLRGV